MRRSLRIAIILPLAAITCWYGMELVHESGHMLAALLTGGKIEHLEFPILGFSRTDISPNPQPGIVAWSGPLLGSALPLIAYTLLRLAKKQFVLFHLFAAFCLLANGAYLGIGSFDRIGDAGDILRHGSSIYWLWLFGSISAAGGLWLLKSLRLSPA